MTVPASPETPLAMQFLGPFEVRVGGALLPRLRSRKGLWLLALLTLRHGQEVERDWLAGVLWPESGPSQALHCLRMTLTDLRRALGLEAWRLQSPTSHTLALDLAAADVDLLAFDATIRQGEEAALQRAVALYRGPLLEGCGEEWAFQERQVREQAYLAARERLAALALEQGETAEAERHLRLVVAVDPLRESTQRALMKVLAAGGNYGAALLCYRELRLRLHRELNIEPDVETKTLFQQLRAEARARADGVVTRRSTGEPRFGRAADSGGGRSPGDGGQGVREGDGGAPPSGARWSSQDRLSRPVSPSQERPVARPEGTVTFLLTDIEGSTKLWLDHPDAMRHALARHDDLAAAVIEQHDGLLVKQRGEGDSLFAVFPRATDAVAAALDLQRALAREPWPAETPLQVRIALHTGEAERRDGDYFGLTVNHGARLRAVGHGGQTLLSQTTAALAGEELPAGASLRELGAHRLKDLQRPEPLFQLMHPELPAEFPPLRSLEAFAHNLPVRLTSFIGREREIAEVKQWLLPPDPSRLLTLTGAGGCGKTRLALQVAADLSEEYRDGVWLVELASLADPGLVPQAVASALGVREEPGRPLTATLADSVRARALLLVLDNCEHLLPACAALAEALLRVAPTLQILATSREGLGIGGERTYRVPSLSLPDPGRLPPVEQLTEYEAVRLFVERAGFAQPRFAVTEENAPSVVAVCQRLDGIPLALELAAARVKALSVEKLNERLDDMFRLLTGGSRTALRRQQTLQALIEWSYDLLTEPEQVLLRRLSVFAGGWTLEAAEAVCVGEGVEEWEVLEVLTRLVEKSLVLYEEEAGEGRYRLLETVRQYARERLLEAGEVAAVQSRHLGFFVRLAEQAEPELTGRGQVAWLDRLEREHDNLRAALAWSREAVEQGLRLGGALAAFWHTRGYWTEGREQVAGLLALPGAQGRTAARAGALHCVGLLVWHQAECGAARALLEESVAIFRELGNRERMASALVTLGLDAHFQGDDRAAREHLEESLVIFRELGEKKGIAAAMNGLGLVARNRGELGTARPLFEECLALFREVGDQSHMAFALAMLGSIARDHRQYGAARALAEESQALSRELGDKWGILFSLFQLGWTARYQGEYGAARAYLEERLAIARELGSLQAAWALRDLGEVACLQREYGAAWAFYEESLAIHRGRGTKEGIVKSLLGLAQVAQAQGDSQKAWALLEEARAIDEGTDACMEQGHFLLEMGDYPAARSRYEEGLARRHERGASTRRIAVALLEVGYAAWLQGEPVVTQSHAREALALFQGGEDKAGLLDALESLAVAALARERKEHAAQLMGAVQALREELGPRSLPVGPDWRRRPRERISEAVRAASLEQAFAAAWAAGRALSLENAVAYALAEDREA